MLQTFSPNKCIVLRLLIATSRRGGVVLLRASEQNVWSSKLNRNTASISQEGHPELKVLRCSSKKSGSKASV